MATANIQVKYPDGHYQWAHGFIVVVRRIPETGYAHAYVKGAGKTWCEVNKHDGRPASVELLIDFFGAPMPAGGAQAIAVALDAAASFARKFDRGE